MNEKVVFSMKRDLKKLASARYDLLVVGGGIYGACMAWEATLRGLSVALVEKADFGSGTSSNSLKIIHGGLRYLQQADLKKMRASIVEMRNWMRIAPHLIHPLPVLIPTYGRGMRSKAAMSLALKINDLMTVGCPSVGDPQKRIPPGRVVSRAEAIRLLPEIATPELTGGAVFYDAQAYNSERLLIAFLRSAAQNDASVANYLKVVSFLKEENRVVGVEVEDQLTGDRFSIRSRTVVNTAGPWLDGLCGTLKGKGPNAEPLFAHAMNIVTRPLFQRYAVGISGENRYGDAETVINKGNRLLFIAPWRGYSIVGTVYKAFKGDPDDLRLDPNDVQAFLDQINRVCPSFGLKMDDVLFVHRGLLPSSGIDPKSGEIGLSQRPRIYDHREEGIDGLFSVTGVKYTAARAVAEGVVDLVFRSWECETPPPSRSASTPIYGGQIDRFESFMDRAVERRPEGVDEGEMRRIACNYGSEYDGVLEFRKRKPGASLLQAEVLHGVGQEMALKLGDIVFRRTEFGSAGHPGGETLQRCAETMGAALGWSPARMKQELKEVNEVFSMGEIRTDGSTLACAAI
jgi:glycerol-3-phosphate dehydrogenase